MDCRTMNIMTAWARGLRERLARPGLARDLGGRAWPPLLLVAAAIALVVKIAPANSWPHTQEGFRYIIVGEHFRLALEGGQWWPRWLPEINGGRGYPTFVFYQALVFFLFTWLRWIIGEPVMAMWAVVATSLALGAVGSYKLCAQAGSKLYGLFGGGLFLLTPYVYVEWLVRGDLSELLALTLVPWALYSLRVVVERAQLAEPAPWPLAGLALATAGVLLAHPITGVLLIPALVIIALTAAVKQRTVDWRLLLRIAGAGVAAVGLATPYWQPFVTLRESVNLQAALTSYFNPTRHTVHWSQLIGGPWAFRGSVPDSAMDSMSFELGRLQLAAALTGAVIAWRTPFIRGAALAFLLSVAMMTPSLTGIWTWPLFKDMQFPWRMLSVTAGLQVALAAGWARKAAAFETPGSRGRLALLLVLLLVSAGWRPEQFTLRGELPEPKVDVRRQLERAPHSTETFAAVNEFLPRTARQPIRTPRGDQPPVVTEPAAKVQFRPEHGPHHIAAEITAAGPTEVIIEQLYFPGWQVRVDGQSVSTSQLEQSLRPDGRIRLRLDPVGPRPRLLEARYVGPPGAGLRWLGVLLGLALLVGLGRLERRHLRRAPSSRQPHPT
jgi:hypothetical protein